MYLLFLFQQQCFSLEPHCSQKIKNKNACFVEIFRGIDGRFPIESTETFHGILDQSVKYKNYNTVPSIQNQNSLLVKWQTDSIIPGDGQGGKEIVPSSHKRSERRHKIILHPDSLREKAI